MPPLPKLNIPALTTLEQSLQSAPRALLLMGIERAEDLADQIAEDQTYPEDWVVYRITGERPELANPSIIAGVELKGELSSLVERLCDLRRLTESDFVSGGLIPADELCGKWCMSRQTLSRLRRRGLVARRVVSESGKSRLMFSKEAVAKFEVNNGETIRRSAEYSRMGMALELKIIRRAVRYKRLLGYSLNAAAARIARRFDRSHEAVRQVLKRYEKSAASKSASEESAAGIAGPIFNEAEPLTDRRREACFRAWRLGIDPQMVCEKFRRSRPAVRRAMNVARAQRLWDLSTGGAFAVPHESPTRSALAERLAGRRNAVRTAARRAEVSAGNPLEEAPVLEGLGAPVPRTNNDFIAAARTISPPIAVEERSRLAAYHALRAKAAELTAGLDRLFPAALALDQIETMLRWAARLKVELVRSQLRLIVETLEGRMGRTMEDMPRARMPRMLMEAVQVVGYTIDHFDAGHGARLAAPVGLAMDKLAVKWVKELQPAPLPPGTRLRASPLLPNAPDFHDWSRAVSPWQGWLEPHFRTRETAESGKLDQQHRDFLRQRFGWYGGPPRTLVELGQTFGMSAIRVVVFEQRLLAQARRPGWAAGATPLTARTGP